MNSRRILPFLFLIVSSPVLADGPYVLGEVTHSNLSLDKGTFNDDLAAAGATGLNSSDHGSGNQWRLQAGYKFNPYFAVEAGYIDLGKADYKANFFGGTAKGSEKAGGIDFAALGIIPVTDNFSLFGKAGLVAAKVQTKLTSGAPAAIGVNDTSTEVKPLIGAGATYSLLKNVDLRFDYDHVSNIGSSGKGGKMDDDMVSAGISYNF
jgi:OmpA-OmpF porin, OOP family